MRRARKEGKALLRSSTVWLEANPFTVVLALLLVGCGPREEPAAPAASQTGGQVTVQGAVIEVRTTQVPLRVEAAGQVTAASQATLSSQIQGMVQELLVREGTSVSRGQTLAVLDSRDLRANLARAEAEFENARAAGPDGAPVRSGVGRQAGTG